MIDKPGDDQDDEEEEFTKTGPRPPTLPGGEWDNECDNNGGNCLASPSNSQLPYLQQLRHRSATIDDRGLALSPAMTPRKSNLANQQETQCKILGSKDVRLDTGPRLGLEPDGVATPPFIEAHTPPYLKWAQTLRHLLQDVEGVELFNRFLRQERCEDSLNFWFACEGLKKQPPDKPEHIQQLIKLIFRKYLRSHNGLHIDNATRKIITDKVGNGTSQGFLPDRTIFDAAQREVEHHISTSTYPNFLKSDIYLQYVQKMQSGGCGVSVDDYSPKQAYGSDSECCYSVPSSRSSSSGRVDVGGPLQTVMEDCEIPAFDIPPTLPLTSKHLMATAKMRARHIDVRRPEANAGLYLQQGSSTKAPNPYHAMYATLIPGSAQDSELQSLSSDAHTDDTVSQTDSSVDGSSHTVSRKYWKQQNRAIRLNANQNKDILSQHFFIPRTQRLPVENTSANPQSPELFAAILIQKLEAVKRSQESQERVDESLRKLEIEESKCGVPTKVDDRLLCTSQLPSQISNMLFNPAMIVEDGNDQSILDEHVSRVWQDSAHQTPNRTPGPHSPPEQRRRVSAPPFPHPNPYMIKTTYQSPHSHSHRHRKERDVMSMFSSDSGAVPDFCDSEISVPGGVLAPSCCPPFHHKHGHHHSGKSASKMINECGGNGDPYGASGQACDLQRRMRDAGKRSSGKKAYLDSSSSGMDSGVSLAYEPSSQQAFSINSREKVMSWVIENEKYYVSHPSDSEKDSSSRHKKSTSSPGPNRSGRGKKPVAYNMSRSGSLERGGHMSWSGSLPQPSQPFMSDPSMPILPPPNTTTQLEEARRRLEDDTKTKLAKSKPGTTSKDRMLYLDLAKGSRVGMSKTGIPGTNPLDLIDEGTVSMSKSSKKPSGAVLGPSVQTSNPPPSETEFTVVGYQFVGDSVPYRTKLAGKNILLRQFKSLITKKGNFRYFFKSDSDEFGTGTVFEEVTDDNDVLPLWEGKIFARLELIE